MAGIVLGVLSMLATGPAGPPPSGAPPVCSGTPETTVNATVTVGEERGLATISAQADASMTGIKNVAPPAIERCVFANGGIRPSLDADKAGNPPPQLPLFTYTADPATAKLSSRWAATPVEISEADLGHARPAKSDLVARTERDSFANSSAFAATMDWRSLTLDIDLCRHPTPRWGCAAGTKGEIRLTVADNVRPRGTVLEAEPQPTTIGHDDANGTMTFVWHYEDVPPPITARLPLTRTVAAATLFPSRPASNDAIPVAAGALEVNWPAVIMAGWDLLLVITLAFTLMWSRRATALGLAAAAAAVSLSVRPYTDWANQQLLGAPEVRMALAWCVIAGALIVVRARPPAPRESIRRDVAGALLALALLTVATLVLRLGPVEGLLLVALTVGVWAAGGLLRDGVHALLVPTAPPTGNTGRLAEQRPGANVLAVFEVAFAVAIGVLIGHSLQPQQPHLETGSVGFSVGWVLLSAVPVLVAICLVQELARRGKQKTAEPGTVLVPPGRSDLIMLALLFAAVADLPDVSWIGLPLSAWILAFIAARFVFLDLHDRHLRGRRRSGEGADAGAGVKPLTYADPALLLRRSIAQEHRRWRWSTLDAKVSEGEQRPEPREPDQTDLGRTFLEQEPADGWFTKARTSAVLGSLVALPLLAYSTWTIAQSISDRLYASGMLYFVVGVVLQFAHWVGLAAVFGAVYRYLPTRTGATKAAFLAGVWSVAALAGELLDRWLGGGSDRLWLFTTLQIFLFLVVVGVFTDLDTVRSAGGSWRRINELYRIRSLRQQVAYVGPLVLAVIGLIIQVQAGAGEQAAAQFVDGLKAAVGG
ncbi:hypothetical protein KOI35_26170 [Actinoplanes bogorensis]|uniref:Uncharacterized protein n=1 Tax=Paractinoplanes bogorensis TaxID=1610840 RepID=A0ABS5YU66_9ACTN|nr:DUF6185 family protein [Actinoplanes bogorensis]MBU2667003.1 hypothetical protein [Actinoplanes bogorensis]